MLAPPFRTIVQNMRRLTLPLFVLWVALVDDVDSALAPHDDIVRAALLD